MPIFAVNLSRTYISYESATIFVEAPSIDHINNQISNGEDEDLWDVACDLDWDTYNSEIDETEIDSIELSHHPIGDLIWNNPEEQTRPEPAYEPRCPRHRERGRR